MKFIAYGDTRDGHDVHRRLVAMIMERKPDFVLQTGDLVHSGSDNGLWKIYDSITGQMRKSIPVYPARGNHDLGGTGYADRVTAPFTSGNKLYYSFDKGNCHLISADSFSPYKPGTEQYHWLENDLAGASKHARHIFVFFHVSPYSIGAHGSDEHLREALCPLFEKYGVRAVFTGHDHIYYRTTRHGILYIVTGGGGAPLYPVDPAKGAITGDVYESVHNLVACEVTGGLVAISAFREDGTLLDRISLHAEDR